MKPRQDLLNDIEHFSKKNLRKVPVYYASVDLERENTIFPIHGFAVAGRKVFTFVVDVMKAPYSITPYVLETANKLSIDTTWKDALAALPIKEYATQEYFVRALIQKNFELQNKYLSIEEMEQTLFYLSDDIRSLTYLNYVCHQRYGSYVPKYEDTKTSTHEYDLYKQGKTLRKKIDVSVVSLQEVLHEQMIYTQYLDEKLAIGKSLNEDYKSKHLLRHVEDAKPYTDKWVAHHDFPTPLREANCNSSLATFIQAAMNKERHKSSLTYRKIPAATLFAFSKDKRMQLHDPMLISECISALRHYIWKRKRYGDGFFSELNGMKGKLKWETAKKMLLVLQDKASVKFTEAEIAALTQGRLWKILEKYGQSHHIAKRNRP